MTCDAFRTKVLGGNAAHGAGAAAHEAECADCRAWLARFVEGRALWEEQPAERLVDDVLARSSGPACERARFQLAGQNDEPLQSFARRLVSAHLDHCGECREFAAELEASLAALPDLAVLDPGPGFAQRVWASTSRRSAGMRWAGWSRTRWAQLVYRPRFAWEAAYVATLCWVLVFGGPVTAWEWSRSAVATIAERPLPERILDLRDDMPRLKTTLVSEAAPKVSAVERVASRFGGRLADVWRTSAAWIERLTDWISVAAGEAWQRSVEWFDQLRRNKPGAPTEPGAGPARSS